MITAEEINIVVGVAVISLLSGVGRVAIRPAALPTIPDRPVTSRRPWVCAWRPSTTPGATWSPAPWSTT